MKRVAFAAVWTFVLTFVFLFLCCLVAGVVSAVTLKGGAKQNAAAIDQATEKWAMPMFLGSLAAAVIFSSMGLLPGTRRRPAVAAEPGVAEDRDSPADRDFRADFESPPSRPIVTVPLSMLDDLSSQLAELGPPLSVHAPGPIASMSGFERLATLALGLVLFFAPVAANIAVHKGQFPPSAHKVLLLVGPLTGLICLVIAFWPRSAYTYRVHDDALVIYDRKNIRIIPWDQIQALNPVLSLFRAHMLETSDGQQLPIKNVRGIHQLFDAVFVRVRDHLLPLMFTRACAGRMVEFGPLAVSSDALRYKGHTIPWDDVTSLVIVNGSGYRHLTVSRRGLLSFWPCVRLNLNLVPNDLLLIELLKRIAPPRLLVAANARW